MKKTILTVSFCVLLGVLFAFSCFAYGSLSDYPVPQGKTIGYFSEDFTGPYQKLSTIGVSSVYVAYTDGTGIVLYVKDYDLYSDFCANAPATQPWFGSPELEFSNFYENTLNSTTMYTNFGDFTNVTDSLIANSHYEFVIANKNLIIQDLQTNAEILQGQNDALVSENQTLHNRIDNLIAEGGDNYEAGYNAGMEDAGAFSSALGTIFSAPFNIFGEIFNFEIFGFNFYTIIQVLFTILICSYFIKLFI